eukprot:5560954-Pyramimonas_sp.AAC.1
MQNSTKTLRGARSRFGPDFLKLIRPAEPVNSFQDLYTMEEDAGSIAINFTTSDVSDGVIKIRCPPQRGTVDLNYEVAVLTANYVAIRLNGCLVMPLFKPTVCVRVRTTLQYTPYKGATGCDVFSYERSSGLVASKPRSRLSASQWQSAGKEYTSNILWNIRNSVR